MEGGPGSLTAKIVAAGMIIGIVGFLVSILYGRFPAFRVTK